MVETGKSSQTESSKGKGKSSFRWNHTDTMILLTMLHGIHEKNGRNSTFQWPSIAQEFKEKTTKDLPVLVIKNKYNYMKKQWAAWKRLRYVVTGAGWDEQKFKVTATEEWWAKQRYEDFFPFKKAPPSRETSRMWDDMFEDVVASGKNAVATFADHLDIVTVQQTCEEEESSGGNDSDTYPQNDDDDDEVGTPQGTTKDTPESVPPKKSKKSKAYTPTFSTESNKKMKPTPANKLFADSCEMVFNASMEFIKAVKSSAGGCSGPEQDAEFDAAVAELNLLVALGLVEEDSRLWCYGMTELAKADRRRIFMRCCTESGKVAWLQHEFDMAIARLPR